MEDLFIIILAVLGKWALIFTCILVSAFIIVWAWEIPVTDRQWYGLMFIFSTVSMVVAMEPE